MSESAPPEVMSKIGAHFGIGQVAEAAQRQPDPEETTVEGMQALELETETDGETVEQPEDDGFSDLEWDGQTYRLPKTLKESFMRNDDYTKKTQALSESSKALDQMRSLAEAQQAEVVFTQSISQEQQELGIIDAYLKQVGQIDWTQMAPDQMLKQHIELTQIKERRALLAQSVDGKRSTFMQTMQAKIQEMRGKAKESVSKSIPGFSEETEKTIRDYAKSEGLTEHEIDNILLDPRSWKVIYKAAQFDKIKAGTANASKQAADKVLRPGVAGQRMPKATADKLNFSKQMAKATTSGQKASVIEERLARSLFKGK